MGWEERAQSSLSYVETGKQGELHFGLHFGLLMSPEALNIK